MRPEWASTLVAKAKVAGLLGAALAAGGVGGAVALSQVTPVSQQVVASAASASPDPETTQAQSTDPGTTGAQSPDPETTSAQTPDPEATDAKAPADCPADVKNHGAHVSSVAHAAPRGRIGKHGKAVSAAAKSDCGKSRHKAGDAKSNAGTSGGGGSAGHDSSGGRSSAAKPKHHAHTTDASSAPAHQSAPKQHGKGHGSKH